MDLISYEELCWEASLPQSKDPRYGATNPRVPPGIPTVSSLATPSHGHLTSVGCCCTRPFTYRRTILASVAWPNVTSDFLTTPDLVLACEDDSINAPTVPLYPATGPVAGS